MVGNFAVHERDDGVIQMSYDIKVHYPHTAEGAYERITIAGTIKDIADHIRTKPVNQIYHFKAWARAENNMLALVIASTIS